MNRASAGKFKTTNGCGGDVYLNLTAGRIFGPLSRLRRTNRRLQAINPARFTATDSDATAVSPRRPN